MFTSAIRSGIAPSCLAAFRGPKIIPTAAGYSNGGGNLEQVEVFETTLRDGSQNIKTIIPTEAKLNFMTAARDAGVRLLEGSAAILPKYSPQMGDRKAVAAAALKLFGTEGTSELVPNARGLQTATQDGVTRVNLFTSASNDFSLKNKGATKQADLTATLALVEQAKAADHSVMVYLSCALARLCPYGESIRPEEVAATTAALLNAGKDVSVALSDTKGDGTLDFMDKVIAQCFELGVQPGQLEMHIHDNTGNAVAHNMHAVKQHGVRRVHVAAGGMGGCQNAPGAGPNTDSVDMVNALHQAGFATGINLLHLAQASAAYCKAAGVPYRSIIGQALLQQNAIGNS